MAACSGDLYCPSWEIFCQCVPSVCPMFNISMLHDRQLEPLYSFVNGEDVFVNLPTGYGKSLIFQMAPLIHVWMNENISPSCWKKDLIILIVSLLLALRQDQVKKLTSLGLKAAYGGAEQEPEVLQDIKEGKYMFVFVSPESMLATERWRNALESDTYQANLIGVAVDEVHCVTEWVQRGATKIMRHFVFGIPE